MWSNVNGLLATIDSKVTAYTIKETHTGLNGKPSKRTVLYTNHVHLTGLQDYTVGTQRVTVSAGTTSKSITIPIINDNTVECDETFKLTIPSVSICGITIGSIRTTEVTIQDDDSK